MDELKAAGHEREERVPTNQNANSADLSQPAASPRAPHDSRQPELDAISWTASEYIEHQKPSSWYALIGLCAVVLAGFIWLLTHDLFPAVAVTMGLLLLVVYGARKPRQEMYTLDAYGITIGMRHYPYHDFRSFKVIPDGAFLSVELTPLKRFAVAMTLFLDPADEDRILDRLSLYLPVEEGAASLADSVMRRIHF